MNNCNNSFKAKTCEVWAYFRRAVSLFDHSVESLFVSMDCAWRLRKIVLAWVQNYLAVLHVWSTCVHALMFLVHLFSFSLWQVFQRACVHLWVGCSLGDNCHRLVVRVLGATSVVWSSLYFDVISIWALHLQLLLVLLMPDGGGRSQVIDPSTFVVSVNHDIAPINLLHQSRVFFTTVQTSRVLWSTAGAIQASTLLKHLLIGLSPTIKLLSE